jgi:hypothetical protein
MPSFPFFAIFRRCTIFFRRRTIFVRENSGRTPGELRKTIEKAVAWSVSSAQQAQVRVQFVLYVAVELVLDDKLADE